MDFLRSQLMDRLRLTAIINLYSLMKIPLLAFLTPTFVKFAEDEVIVKIRLGYRSRNHLHSMYFGALAVGAELSIAATVVNLIQQTGKPIEFIFKNFQSEFLRRADGHVLFVCKEVTQINAFLERAMASTERLEETFSGFAKVEGTTEPVMRYKLTLSVRNRAGASK